jgi:Putative DNA-binding domain
MLPRRGDRYEAADVDRAIAEAWPESETLEYKADPAIMLDDRRALTPEQKLKILVARAVCAFANTGGGVLVVGVGEKDGVPVATTPHGLALSIGRDRADERVDFIISGCVEPRPSCRVELAPIDDDRAYVLVEVAARGGGPHRVTNTSEPALNGRYYVRRGRESIPADHYTLRALFADSLEEGQRVRDYLAKQGLADNRDDNPRFGRHDPAHQLAEQPGKRARAALIVTSIPDVLRGEIFDTDDPEVRRILAPGGRGGWLEERATLEGRMLFRSSDPPLLQSYFHVHRNGYLEAGDARIFAFTAKGQRVYADAIAEVLFATLERAAQLYEHVGLLDRVRVDLHLREVADTLLALRSSASVSSLSNTTKNLTISELLSVSALSDPLTRIRFDRRLANAYGLEDGVVLNPDGSKRIPFMGS